MASCPTSRGRTSSAASGLLAVALKRCAPSGATVRLLEGWRVALHPSAIDDDAASTLLGSPAVGTAGAGRGSAGGDGGAALRALLASGGASIIDDISVSTDAEALLIADEYSEAPRGVACVPLASLIRCVRGLSGAEELRRASGSERSATTSHTEHAPADEARMLHAVAATAANQSAALVEPSASSAQRAADPPPVSKRRTRHSGAAAAPSKRQRAL